MPETTQTRAPDAGTRDAAARGGSAGWPPDLGPPSLVLTRTGGPAPAPAAVAALPEPAQAASAPLRRTRVRRVRAALALAVLATLLVGSGIVLVKNSVELGAGGRRTPAPPSVSSRWLLETGGAIARGDVDLSAQALAARARHVQAALAAAARLDAARALIVALAVDRALADARRAGGVDGGF